MSRPKLNRVVADFKAAATGDKTIQLKTLRGHHVVIYFYPKDATPGCTTEGQDFRDLHAKFKAKQQFPFDLISDPDERVCRQFDVIQEKSLYGRKFMGVERSTFLIDADGKLRQEWRKVKVKGHAAEVLDAVKALK